MYCYGTGAGYGRFLEKVEQPLYVPKPKPKRKNHVAQCRHVRCVETGEVFFKISDIGNYYEDQEAKNLVVRILNSMKREGGTAFHFHWVKVSDKEYEEYCKRCADIVSELRTDPDSPLHGSYEAARLKEEDQCSCERCQKKRASYMKLRKFSSK